VSEQPAKRRLGVFGGTFDPIHLGHLVIAQEAAVRLRLERVLFVPTGQPPHKALTSISSAGQRHRMVEVAIADNSCFALSTAELHRPGPSYTIDTLAQLRVEYGADAALYLIMGGDMVYDLPEWRDPAEIVRQVAGIAALHRPGYGFAPERVAELEQQLPGLGAALHPLEGPLLDISATQIRARVRQGMPIRYLVPDGVAAFIHEHGLYQAQCAEAT
jgi:nicotinate-nucleotide adenylyltransferase